MAKQIKIGLDKVPSPVTKQFTQLVDIEGTKLFDAAGNPLVTEEEASIQEFANSNNALSVFANNTPVQGGNIPIVEQFPETSDVSSSLLGIPRSEEQLSLFSDVASYGLDEDAWEEYTFADATVPYQWYQKEHPIHGRRSNPTFNEGSTEQALFLKTFPSQYSYPQGPRTLMASDPSGGFKRYMNFIALGRWFHNEFTSRGFPEFADRWFLDPTCANVIDRNDPATILTDGQLDFINGSQLTFNQNTAFYDVDYGKDDIQDSFDAIERWTFFFQKIKNGEDYYPFNASVGRFKENADPAYSKIVSFATGTEVLPGGSSTRFQVAQLESKRAFRYQPGRASGFTFGSRMTNDPISSATVCEWGCANETDQYMFQLKGSQFNIVRRSTIPMPQKLLERQGLTIDDQSDQPIYVRGLANSTPLFETIIPRSKWNGDALLGVGDSGYILSFEDVTMYKIEFSWYGAIGAKFYAYIPSGNGDARWVLMHTFVIENGLGQPILQNPDFKFKYIIYSTNTATIQSPICLYKYGSSYYIDGGDEGTQRLSTVTSLPKVVSQRTPLLGLLPKDDILNSDGLAVKNTKKSYPTTISVNAKKDCRIDLVEVLGSRDGVHFNYSPSLHMNGRHPRTRDLTFKYTLGDTILQIIQPATPQITGTVYVNNNETTLNGVGTQFQTDLQVGDVLLIGTDTTTEHKIDKINSQTEIILSDAYTNSGSSDILQANAVTAQKVQRLNPEDKYAKIVADGIYGNYVTTSVSNGKSSPVLRRNSPTHDFALKENIEVRDSLKVDGSKLDRTQSFTGKLVNYHTVVGSDTPITSNKFKIHWLNPNQYEGTYGNRHFAEFGIGVTPHKPVEPNGSDIFDRLHFETSPGNFKEFDREEYPFLEYVHDRTRFDERENAELFEWHGAYGRGRFEVDPRNPLPRFGSSGTSNQNSKQSGFISSFQGKVEVQEFAVSTTLLEPLPADGTKYSAMKRLVFTSSQVPSNSEIKFTGTLADGTIDPSTGISEIGASFAGTGFFFRSDVIIPSGGGNRYVYVDANITSNADGVTLGTNFGPTVVTDAGDTKNIQTKVVTLFDDFQAQSFDDDGTELFQNHKFSVSQAIAFNDQPLYPVFALQDNARINSIVIEEIFEDGRSLVHSPTFKKDDSNYNSAITIDSSIPAEDRSLTGGPTSSQATSSSVLTPTSFNEEDRQSGLRFDKSCLNPLRAGTTISSFYAEGGDPTKIDMSNLFAQDRKGLSPGLLNNTALFFIATELDTGSASDTVEIALTIKEQ